MNSFFEFLIISLNLNLISIFNYITLVKIEKIISFKK